MKHPIRRWLLLPLMGFMLAACQDESASRKAAEEARIKREVERRVTVERKRLEIHVKQLHTVRVVGLLCLSGGALGTLIWLGWSQETLRAASGSTVGIHPRPFIRHPLRGGRVLD